MVQKNCHPIPCGGYQSFHYNRYDGLTQGIFLPMIYHHCCYRLVRKDVQVTAAMSIQSAAFASHPLERARAMN